MTKENKNKLENQLKNLMGLCELGTCINNEWYSVGMEPPKESIIAQSSLCRKIRRICRQIKVDPEL